MKVKIRKDIDIERIFAKAQIQATARIRRSDSFVLRPHTKGDLAIGE